MSLPAIQFTEVIGDTHEYRYPTRLHRSRDHGTVRSAPSRIAGPVVRSFLAQSESPSRRRIRCWIALPALYWTSPDGHLYEIMTDAPSDTLDR
jgi:hypothetical protein